MMLITRESHPTAPEHVIGHILLDGPPDNKGWLTVGPEALKELVETGGTGGAMTEVELEEAGYKDHGDKVSWVKARDVVAIRNEKANARAQN